MRFDVRDALAKFSQKARTKPAILNTEPSQIGLAFRTRPTAPPQACTQTGAATKSQNDPNTGATAARASVEGSHLLSGFAQPYETMPKRARRILATPRRVSSLTRAPFLPPPRGVTVIESGKR